MLSRATFLTVLWTTLLTLLVPAAQAQALAVVAGRKLAQEPAQVVPGVVDKVTILSATLAGKRVVGVGDHGVVLLSDDQGKTFRQAQAVPTRVTLTGVSFADEHAGWAVGHWGTILHTSDGGEHWSVQRDDLGADRPLLSVLFLDDQNGYAVGIWSLFLVTHDGGKTWSDSKVPPPPGSTRADLNLFALMPDGHGGLFVCAERGLVLHTDAAQANWSFTETGGKGSLWAGLRLGDGTLLVGGLLGRLARSTDEGKTFVPIDTGSQSSITSIAEIRPGIVVAVALDGVTLASGDAGQHFTLAQREDRLSLTAVGPSGRVNPVIFSKQGLVRPAAKP